MKFKFENHVMGLIIIFTYIMCIKSRFNANTRKRRVITQTMDFGLTFMRFRVFNLKSYTILIHHEPFLNIEENLNSK
jgi:hypothetical protein